LVPGSSPGGPTTSTRTAFRALAQRKLRLRQAACHSGLIDKSLRGESRSKLDALLEQVREVVDEGHKALVFSQFTSLLSIVRDRLDRDKIVYEYLDGQTRDRAARVERFQTDPACPLFLISLKAGGLGLNLTAADLDPWWNPAVEAQAIDRTHRIGQARNVFAYRLVARGTVEEKVIELQKSKRALAESILTRTAGSCATSRARTWRCCCREPRAARRDDAPRDAAPDPAHVRKRPLVRRQHLTHRTELVQ